MSEPLYHCTVVFVVGYLCEELGFGLALGSNLIIYVLKQATNHWLLSQGSRDMEDIPRKQLVVNFISPSAVDMPPTQKVGPT